MTFFLAASLTLLWQPVPDAVEYWLWWGPSNYTHVAMTTDATITLTNLTAGQPYQFALSAFTRENGSELATLRVTPREVVWHFEWSASPDGPWTVQATNVVSVGPGFYRARGVVR